MVIHGSWCNSRVWRTACRECQQQVYFFSCSCGSAVLFEKLGAPWPKHICPPPITVYKRQKGADGTVTAWLTPDGSITATRPAETTLIEPGFADLARDRDAKDERPIRKYAALSGERKSIHGIVRELRSDVDPYADLGVPRSAIGKALLGVLAHAKGLAKMTVHVGSLTDGSIDSFTFYIARDLLAKHKMRRGAIVDVELEAIKVPGITTRWFAHDLFVVF